MFYPMKMMPIYKNYLWGGRNLEKYNKQLPEGITAESWEVSVHPDGQSMIANGPFFGMTFNELFLRYPKKILGASLYGRYHDTFPVLFKLIDASAPLSVQVHPDDAYAQTYENELYGKHEAWYILDAIPGAEIIFGLVPGTKIETVEKSIMEGSLKACLQTVKVRRGDLLDVPPGLVHAIGPGIVLAELQQSSNLTYRVYDYDRIDANGNKRPLHLTSALNMIRHAGSPVPQKPGKSRRLQNKHFNLEVLSIKNGQKEMAPKDRFSIWFVAGGHADFHCGFQTVRAATGDTIFLPGCLSSCMIEGSGTLLKMYAPDLILNPAL